MTILLDINMVTSHKAILQFSILSSNTQHYFFGKWCFVSINTTHVGTINLWCLLQQSWQPYWCIVHLGIYSCIINIVPLFNRASSFLLQPKTANCDNTTLFPSNITKNLVSCVLKVAVICIINVSEFDLQNICCSTIYRTFPYEWQLL